MMRTQRAMIGLLDLVEASIPEARLAGESFDPVLSLPAPNDYAVWIMMRGRDYYAAISRRLAPERVRDLKVGRWGDPPTKVWADALDWFNSDPELADAWERTRSTESGLPPATARPPLPTQSSGPPSAVLTQTSIAETAATEVDAARAVPRSPDAPREAPMPIDPLGYDADHIMFKPLATERLVTYRVEISAEAAEYIQAASTLENFDERHIMEAGALMYLAHMTGAINILGPEGAKIVREKADLLEEGFDADAMLATLVVFMKFNDITDAVIALFKDARQSGGQ